MNIKMRAVCGVAAGMMLVSLRATQVWAANAYPLFTDINVAPQAFGAAAAGSFGGLYTLDSAAKLNGNDLLSINQKGQLACCHGAQIEISISNGENGVNSTNNGANVDIPNPTPANPAWAAIGNPSGKLENGNVLRFSAWFRSDPANPITQDPQVQPILKWEMWKEALSTFADTNATQAAPNFGDRVFDQDQQGSALGIPDLPHWVDLNGDGVVLDASATVGNGRVTGVATDHWTLAQVTYTVDSTEWLGIGAEAFGANDVTKIESAKAVMFMGDFANTNLTGDGPDGGNLLVDNALVEVFRNAAAVTPINNPDPTLSEGQPGDYNNDGKVNAADYTVWRDHLGQTFTLPNRDGTNSGAINQNDYTFWKNHFGAGGPGSGAGISGGAVPEPTSLCLALLATVLVGRLRCRLR